MSRAELKKIVDRSSPADRLFLTAYLHHVATREDPQLQEELASAHREIDRGDKIGLQQLKQLDHMLTKTSTVSARYIHD
ncbi:MAG: hypothetical protein V4773_30005 [Verrucomicrobiota bacterium]